MADDENQDKKKTAYAELGSNLCKLLLVILPALGIGTYAHLNHQQSAAGYETLSKSEHAVMDRLEALEKRLLALEARPVPSSQPISIDVVIPERAPRRPPRAAEKAPTKSPIVLKGAGAAPASAPSVAHPAPAARPAAFKPLRRSPLKFDQVKF